VVVVVLGETDSVVWSAIFLGCFQVSGTCMCMMQSCSYYKVAWCNWIKGCANASLPPSR